MTAKIKTAIDRTVESEVVRVSSVVDCRKNPSWIRRHLGNA
jgi:hypothetical protein